MKVIVISVGTRGDMEPFLAIGEILKERGHDVIAVFPEQFRDLAEDSGFRFASLGSEFIEFLESDTGKTAMGGGSGFKKFVAIVKLAMSQKKMNQKILKRQYDIIEAEKPDRIVHNGKAVYPVIWGLEDTGKTILLSPVPYLHYVKDHAHVVFNRNFGPFLNKITYSLANYGLLKTIMTSIKWLDITKGIKQKVVQAALFSNKAIYTVSPTLFNRPAEWNDNLQILGYHERNKIVNWKPDQSLTSFLDNHDKPLLITFGSMTNTNPKEKTRIIIDILTRNKIPAIINTASGGLVEPDEYNRDLLYFVSRIPYDWVFPKIYGVIHHGGSGTTHMALKYGCASMIIPHIIDQFVWNRIVFEKGAGPKGMKIGKLSTRKLEPKILELVNNPEYKRVAEQISIQMSKEKYEDELCNMIIEK